MCVKGGERRLCFENSSFINSLFLIEIVSHLMNHLISVASSSNKHIFTKNIQIIKKLLIRWKNHVIIDYSMLHSLMTSVLTPSLSASPETQVTDTISALQVLGMNT